MLLKNYNNYIKEFFFNFILSNNSFFIFNVIDYENFNVYSYFSNFLKFFHNKSFFSFFNFLLNLFSGNNYFCFIDILKFYDNLLEYLVSSDNLELLGICFNGFFINFNINFFNLSNNFFYYLFLNIYFVFSNLFIFFFKFIKNLKFLNIKSLQLI